MQVCKCASRTKITAQRSYISLEKWRWIAEKVTKKGAVQHRGFPKFLGTCKQFPKSVPNTGISRGIFCLHSKNAFYYSDCKKTASLIYCTPLFNINTRFRRSPSVRFLGTRRSFDRTITVWLAVAPDSFVLQAENVGHISRVVQV